jgi:hypothetical protein
MKLETKENEFCEDRTAFTSKSLTESEIAWVARAPPFFYRSLQRTRKKWRHIRDKRRDLCCLRMRLIYFVQASYSII